MPNDFEKPYPLRDLLSEESLDPNSSLAKMLEFVGRGKRVLDVGCASGYLARLMTSRGCTVVGIDVSAEAAQAAAQYCTRTIVADLDIEPLQALLPDEEFDVAVFGDVLEHLRDPWKVLGDARKLLAYRGYAVVSVPNIAHGGIRLGLLRGEFDYSEFGILDDTHLRFFTRRTLDQLFIRAGYRVEKLERTLLPLFEPSELVPALTESQFDPVTVERVRADPECDTLQFVALAKALDDRDHLAQLGRSYALASSQAIALDETRLSQQATNDELERTQRAYADLQAASQNAITGYDELAARLSASRAELDNSERRHAQETIRLESEFSATEGRLLELQLRHDRLQKAFSLISDQFEAIKDIETYCRLQGEQGAGAPPLAMLRVLHDYVTSASETIDGVASSPQRRAFEAIFREHVSLLLAQIESLDARLGIREAQLLQLTTAAIDDAERKIDPLAPIRTKIRSIYFAARRFGRRILRRLVGRVPA